MAAGGLIAYQFGLRTVLTKEESAPEPAPQQPEEITDLPVHTLFLLWPVHSLPVKPDSHSTTNHHHPSKTKPC